MFLYGGDTATTYILVYTHCFKTSDSCYKSSRIKNVSEGMSDVYKDTMKEIYREAPPELVEGFKKKMGFIQDQYQHSKKTVQSCLEGMADPPLLVELLAAAYLVNGGLLFKHEGEQKTDQLSSDELESFLHSIEELSCSPSSSPDASEEPATHST